MGKLSDHRIGRPGALKDESQNFLPHLLAHHAKQARANYSLSGPFISSPGKAPSRYGGLQLFDKNHLSTTLGLVLLESTLEWLLVN